MNNNACFSCGELGHFTKNCLQCQGRGKGEAKANLIDFDQEEETLYEGSQMKGSRVALVKMEMDVMMFDKQ
jgi:hypothetical protein